jgi:hypothetical protein
MTESEAKKKWCPMVRGHEKGAAGFNLGVMGGEDKRIGTCIGPACMMWRFDQGRVEFSEAPPREDGEPMVKIQLDRAGNGYCGLAGKP